MEPEIVDEEGGGETAEEADVIGFAEDSVFSVEVGDEVVAGELRLALEELGEVAGVVVNNDILDAIFSRFCIGK